MDRIKAEVKLTTHPVYKTDDMISEVGRVLSGVVGEGLLKKVTIHTQHFENDEILANVDFYVISKENGDKLLNYLNILKRQKANLPAQVISEDLLKLLKCEK